MVNLVYTYFTRIQFEYDNCRLLYNPFIVRTDQMGKVEVSSQCLHGDLPVNQLLIRILGRATLELMRREQFNVFLEPL